MSTAKISRHGMAPTKCWTSMIRSFTLMWIEVMASFLLTHWRINASFKQVQVTEEKKESKQKKKMSVSIKMKKVLRFQSPVRSRSSWSAIAHSKWKTKQIQVSCCTSRPFSQKWSIMKTICTSHRCLGVLRPPKSKVSRWILQAVDYADVSKTAIVSVEYSNSPLSI